MSTPFSGTDEQRANLLKLAEYLEGTQLKAAFDMKQFCEIRWLSECGSVGCAVGHGPHAGIEKTCGERWDEYSQRVFSKNGDAWDWMFDAGWFVTDNTPSGAAARIRWLLDKGLPENWEEQLDGEVPLCYVTPREV